ncbi:MAG TPA: hypothetical protein VI384_04455 [Candidatus Dormibacteraeota bacterium]
MATMVDLTSHLRAAGFRPRRGVQATAMRRDPRHVEVRIIRWHTTGFARHYVTSIVPARRTSDPKVLLALVELYPYFMRTSRSAERARRAAASRGLYFLKATGAD